MGYPNMFDQRHASQPKHRWRAEFRSAIGYSPWYAIGYATDERTAAFEARDQYRMWIAGSPRVQWEFSDVLQCPVCMAGNGEHRS